MNFKRNYNSLFNNGQVILSTLLSQIAFLILFLSTFALQGQNLYVNEFMASNATTLADEFGEFDDWIEIHNTGTTAIDLANYYISDDPALITLYQIPTTNTAKTTVPAGGYLILWADKDLTQGENHVNIKLGGGGESVILTAPDGTTVINDILFGPQSDDVSYGRETDAAANFVFFTTPTPGAENVASGPATYTVSLNIPIDSPDDDGEQFPAGTVTLSSSDIEMVQDGGLVLIAGYKFNNVSLPDDAIITSAYLQFYAEEVQTGAANINIAADASPNPAPFVATNNNLSGRATTSNTANWVPAPWPSLNANGVDQQTVDLSTVVQEVISTTGWQAGNSLVFLMTGSGTRTTFSYNQSSSKAAVLHLQAEVPLPTEPIDQIYINELSAFATPYEDETGKREDWIELYNPNTSDVNIGGLYLTDDYGNLDKWQIGSSISVPAGGYTTFFADNDLLEGVLHAGFKLKSGGEEVALVQLLATGLEIIDSISFDEVPFLASYGRTVDGGSTWKLFGETTPDASNNGALSYLSAPDFSLASGLYTGSQTLILSHPDPAATIYYTTDASLPTTSSTQYTGPITINSTQSVRAIATRSGYVDSEPADHAYMVNVNPNMPVIYLTTDPDNFFDDEIGIYVDGTNGVAAYCSPVPVNWAQDWERPCNLKMFLPDGTVAFDVNAGVEISGACSRGNEMRSLAINLREKIFGSDVLDFEVFPQRSLDEHQRFKLRNSGQDYYRLGFRDMLNQTLLFKDIDIEAQAGRPVLFYLNGEFWGLYNIREKYSGEHFEELYGVVEEDLDIIKSPGLPWRDIKKGFETDYLALFDFVDNGDLTVQADYDYFDTQVDVNEFTNYWIAMTYMANYDWPANNLTIWRDRVNQTKWRYGVADTDGSTNNFLSNSANPDFNTFAFINVANSTSWPNHSNSTLFLRKLLERTEYRDEFIQRTCTFMEVLFPEERTHLLIDSISGLFQPNLQAHLDNWAFDNAMGGNEASWNEWIVKYKTFWEDRPDFMRQHINDFYNLSGYYDLTINFNANTEGDVFVNSNTMEIPFNYIGTYFRNIPVRLTAVADPGYQFSHWQETGVTDATIDYVAVSNSTLTPIFVPDGLILTLTCPADISTSTSGAFPTVPVSWTEPSASSTCTSGSVTLTQTGGLPSGSNFPEGTFIISYEATDGCGNVENCSFTITVTSGSGMLTLTCPENITVNALPGAGSASVSWAEPTANTTCGAGNATLTQTAGSSNGSSFPIGQTTVSFQAIDPCGHAEICSFVVTVNSASSNLTLVCPANISETAAGGTNVNWTAPTGTSDCTTGSVTTTQIAGQASGSFFNVGTYTITYEAVDGCGTTETCSFTITVLNGSGTLTLTCPTNQVLVLPQGANSMPVNWSLPTTSTTCGGGTQNPNCGTLPTGFATLGSLGDSEYFISLAKTPWTVAQADCETYGANLVVIGDAAENQFLDDNIDVVIHIGLNDVASEGTPEWSNGEPVGYTNYTSSANNTATNDYCYWAPWSGKWGFYSNLVYKYYVMELDCGGGSSVSLTQTGGPANGSSLTAGLYNVTYEANDDCGDVQMCSFTIEVQANTQSSISLDCPSNITVTEVAETEGAAANWSAATATTTCNNGGLSISQTGGLPSGSVFAVGSHTITYGATDACGNVENCTFTITVLPDSPSGEYCMSKGTTPWQHWIANVSFNTINNNSGKSQYSDFTGISTSVDPDGSYTFSLTPGFSWTQWDSYVSVWIDYNGDFDFNDPGEKVVEQIVPAGSSGGTPNTGSATVTIPTNSPSGATQMRVAMKRDAYADPCETFSLGEVEDYTVFVNSNGSNLEGISESLFFTAMKDGRDVSLDWVTNNEFKNEYFVLERSVDGLEFESLKEVESIYENTQAYAVPAER